MSTSLPPGPSLPMPLQTAAHVTLPVRYLEFCRRRYGDTFTIRIVGTGPMVYLANPADARAVFRGDPEVFRAGEANAPAAPLVGPRSVLVSDGEAHTRARKLMVPAFHGDSVSRLTRVMAEVAAAEIVTWPAGEEFAVHPHMQAITLEVILRAVIGADRPDRIAELRRVLPPMMGVGPLAAMALLRPGLLRFWPWSKQLGVRREADLVLHDEIARARADRRLGERHDVLAALVQAAGDAPEGDLEVRDQLVTLLLAGHETTATALSWTLEQLVRAPAVLERARDAADQDDHDYLDAVIAESLRRRPVAAEVVRRVSCPTEVAGFTLPAGTTVAVGTALVHGDPGNYEDADAFAPERYLGHRPDPAVWFPFGGGTRRCVGARFAAVEMRVVLGEILRRVDLAVSTAPPETPRRRHVTVAPSRGARVTVTLREPS
ncbi:cytochrome P450 [Amycolatopsis sp. A1MSW2902]|uniref:cytochrome P450 n=1 Tax=Amycolatopsis sp. A1MSW2902 TaxID=687413 RepID=UPI00307D3B0A